MSATTTIFISAYRNVSIRYILYSDIFKYLKHQPLRIVVFVKKDDIEYYRHKLAAPNVVFEPVLYEKALKLFRGNPLSRWMSQVRRCMSGQKDGFVNTTDSVNVYLQKRILADKGFLRRFAFFLIRCIASAGTHVAFIRQGIVSLESQLFPGKIYDSYFLKYNPCMLITSSLGYMIDPLFMRAAKRNGCPVVSIIHNWDNPTTKDYRGAVPDRTIVWNDKMKKEVHVFHDIPKDNIYIGGIAHWDIYFNGHYKPTPKREFLDTAGLQKNRKIILFGTSSYMLFHSTFKVIEELLEAIKAARIVPSPQLLVRLHPAYMMKEAGREGQVVERFQSQIDRIKSIFGDLVAFSYPFFKVLNSDIDMPSEDLHGLADALTHSDVLLTEYSTLMIEAAIFDLPVINVAMYGFRDTDKSAAYFENFSHLRRILSYGAARNAYSFDKLIEHISAYLSDRSRDQMNRRILVEEEIPMRKGNCGLRIGRYISEML